jgi:hemerythrin-like metal-binding protein
MIEWSDIDKIGDAEVDAQHQELFDVMNKLLTAQDRSSLRFHAMRLYKHTREHFKHEEGLMHHVKYPHRAAHAAEHNELITKLNLVSEKIASETLDKQALESFIWDWIYNHVRTSDAKIASHLFQCSDPPSRSLTAS